MEENNNSPLEKYQSYWDKVEKSLNEGTKSGYKIAVIETEKILGVMLDDKKFPGESIEERLENSKKFLKNYDKLNYARAMYRKVVEEPGFDIASEDTKEIIAGYYQAMENIAKIDLKKLSLKEKINFLWQGRFYRLLEKVKKFLILALIFFFLVFAATETTTGKSISEITVGFSRFLFYKAFPVLIVTVAAIIVAAGTIYYWQNRRK